MGGKRGECANAAFALLMVFVLALLAMPGAAESSPAVIVNEFTADRVSVPGVGVSFVPAPGLSLSKQFDGFSSQARGIEVIVANIREPYATISEMFTDDALKMRGVDVKSRGALSIDGAEGILIKALHADGAKRWAKWILLLDGGEYTLVVNGVFASGDAAAAGDVEKMVKSAAIGRERAVSEDREADDR